MGLSERAPLGGPVALTLLALGALVACPPAKPIESSAPPPAGSSAPAASTPLPQGLAADDAATAPPAPLAPLVAGAEVPRAPKLRVRRLTHDAAAACSTTALLAKLGSCRALRTQRAEGTSPTPRNVKPSDLDPTNAFDASTCRVWNSGGPPPQAIRTAISDDAPINGILLMPEMSPDGPAVHVLELGSSSFIAEASFATSTAHVILLDTPSRAQTLTVRTTSSPSWVAWQRIVPFTCDGAVALGETTEVSPETPRPKPKADFIEVRVPGRGDCTKDEDCVPASCCHPRTCVATALAPACAGVGCPQNVVQGTIGQGARCACIQKRCGALRREQPDRGGGLL